jgi:hypothetical protein
MRDNSEQVSDTLTPLSDTSACRAQRVQRVQAARQRVTMRVTRQRVTNL